MFIADHETSKKFGRNTIIGAFAAIALTLAAKGYVEKFVADLYTPSGVNVETSAQRPRTPANN